MKQDNICETCNTCEFANSSKKPDAADLSPALYHAVYVHIPFCLQKCLYCDFASYAGYGEDAMRFYAEAVCREIRLQSRQPLPAAFALPVNKSATVYFGGGTPSLMPLAALEQIAEELRRCGFWRQPAEATVEVNPGTADFAKLQGLREIGFDRVSIGVQSLNEGELRKIGRVHTARQAQQALEWAQQAGFERVSADIIYGLPGQSAASLYTTLEALTASGIGHISAYSLIVEEDTPLERLLAQGVLQLPEEEETDAMYDMVQQFLAERGFERYEISNYARSGQYSRHNDVYWRYLPYAAFGAAACAFCGSARRTAAADVREYIKKAGQNGGNALASLYSIEKLTPETALGEFMFMGLRRSGGADLTAARQRFSVDVLARFGAQLAPWLKNGYVIYDAANNFLRLTERGMAAGNRIFEIFVKA